MADQAQIPINVPNVPADIALDWISRSRISEDEAVAFARQATVLQNNFYAINAGVKYLEINSNEKIEAAILNTFERPVVNGFAPNLNQQFTDDQQRIAMKLRKMIRKRTVPDGNGNIFFKNIYIMALTFSKNRIKIPVFYFRSRDGSDQYLDLQARVYKDFNDFLENNVIEPALCCYPVNGHYGQIQTTNIPKFDERIALDLAIYKSPSCSWIEQAKQWTPIVLKGCAVLLMATGRITSAKNAPAWLLKWVKIGSTSFKCVNAGATICLSIFSIIDTVTYTDECLASVISEISSIVSSVMDVMTDVMTDDNKIKEHVINGLAGKDIKTATFNDLSSKTIKFLRRFSRLRCAASLLPLVPVLVAMFYKNDVFKINCTPSDYFNLASSLFTCFGTCMPSLTAKKIFERIQKENNNTALDIYEIGQGLIDTMDIAKYIYFRYKCSSEDENPAEVNTGGVNHNNEAPDLPENNENDEAPDLPENNENDEAPDLPENNEAPDLPENDEAPDLPENNENDEALDLPENNENDEAPDLPENDEEQTDDETNTSDDDNEEHQNNSISLNSSDEQNDRSQDEQIDDSTIIEEDKIDKTEVATPKYYNDGIFSKFNGTKNEYVSESYIIRVITTIDDPEEFLCKSAHTKTIDDVFDGAAPGELKNNIETTQNQKCKESTSGNRVVEVDINKFNGKVKELDLTNFTINEEKVFQNLTLPEHFILNEQFDKAPLEFQNESITAAAKIVQECGYTNTKMIVATHQHLITESIDYYKKKMLEKNAINKEETQKEFFQLIINDSVKAAKVLNNFMNCVEKVEEKIIEIRESNQSETNFDHRFDIYNEDSKTVAAMIFVHANEYKDKNREETKNRNFDEQIQAAIDLIQKPSIKYDKTLTQNGKSNIVQQTCFLQE